MTADLVAPVTISTEVSCPTEGCAQVFECSFILGHISTGPYTLHDMDERLGASMRCPRCGLTVMISSARELRVSASVRAKNG